MTEQTRSTTLARSFTEFWRWLTELPVSIREPTHRRQAQLLAAMLAFMVPLALLALAATSLLVPSGSVWRDREFLLGVGVCLNLVVAYGLNRAGRYAWAAWLTVAILNVAVLLGTVFVFLGMVPDFRLHGVNLLFYLAVPIVLGGILLSARSQIALLVCNMVGMLILPLLFPHITYSAFVAGPLGFVAILSFLVILTTIHRSQVKRDRQSELLEEEEHYRSFLEMTFEGIGIFEGQTLVEANSGFAQMFGYSLSRVLGRPMLDFFADDMCQAVAAKIETGTRQPCEAVGFKKDGTTFHMEFVVNPCRHRGRTVRVVAIRDITERRGTQVEIQQRTAQLEALRQVGLELAAELDLEDLLCSIVSRAVALVGGTTGGIYLYRPQRDVIEWAMSVGPDTAPIGSALHRGEGLSGKVWNTGDPLIVNDYRHWEGRSPIYDGYPWTAVVGVPVCWGDEFLGVLDVLKNAPDSFSTADAELLSLFANQAAIAIKNARLFRAEREQRELAEALRQATAAVSSTLDLDEVLDRILDQMDRVIPGDASNVMLIEGERARFVRWRGYEKFNGGDHLRSVAPHIADIPFLQQMQETGEPVIIPATHTNDRWKRASGWVRSYAGAPIRVRDEIIGFLSVNSATPGFFSQTHTDHLRAFADQASLAVENARMYHEVRQRNRELALLNRITAASAASREIETILEVVCRELALAFSVPQSAAALFNEEKTEAFIVAEYLAEGRPSALGEVIPAEDNPASQYLLKHKTPLVINDAQTDPRQAIIHRLMRRRGTISLLLLPLVIDGEVVGTLGIDAIEHRPFSAKEVELAQRMAEQVSGALARTRLEETQRRLSTAVEQAAESIIIADTDGHIVYVNPAFRRTTGYSLAEVVGQDLRCLNNGEQDTNAHREMWRALQSGRTWQGRMVNRKKDGSSCTMDSTITPVRNQVGEIVNYVATMRDVTREVELEEQFRQAQKMEALGRLAGGVAHDFNNLLTVIHISTRLLERDLHPKDPLCEHVQRIRDVGERAAKLNKQLLSFSRRQVIEPRVLNLNDLVSDLSRMLQRIIGEDIELTLSLAEDLWSVKVDSAQMDQVIMNVVVNARDAMPEGGLLTIETANVVLDRAYTARHVEAKVGEHVLLSIGDTGVGMDSEVKAHLFEPFFTTKERGKGTGLGLATVFGIVKQSRGHIEVESAPEQGATFRIYLPRAEMEEVRTQRPSASARLTRGTETVLVVEDEDAVRELTVRILKRRGYDVLVATNGAEALRISEQYDGCIDLLLTDVVMPQMSGPELVKRLNAQRPDVRVIYMSGYTNEKIVQHGALEPDAAFVAKPLTLESLTQKVRTVLDGRT